MNRIIKPYLLILLLTGVFACQEDTIEPDVFGSLVGEVLLESDNSAIANVTISTNPPTSTILTDNLGRFAFDNMKVGTYSIRTEKTGLASAVQSVTILEGKTSNVVIKLQKVDETNTAPDAPSNPSPAKGSVQQPVSMELSWTASDPDGDSLIYDVILYHSGQNPATILAADIHATKVDVSDLKYGTTYFWQVAVKDGTANPVYGEVWSFTTIDFPPHPFVFTKIANGKYDIFCASIANQFYQLTTNPGSNYRPRISPDGNRIAFLSNNFPNTQIFTIKRDGSQITLVPATEPIDGYNKFELDFAWSPDGTRLIYMRYNRLYKINLDGSGLNLFAELTGTNTFAEVDWTAQGNKIIARTVGLMPYQSKILLYDANGNQLQEVVADLPGSTGGPVFSIDGNSILYTQDVSGFESPDGRQLDAHIFLKNISTGVITDVSVNKVAGTNDLDPRFSPDESKVIFVNTSNVPGSERNIMLMNLQGLGRTLIFENSDMPDWR